MQSNILEIDSRDPSIITHDHITDSNLDDASQSSEHSDSYYDSYFGGFQDRPGYVYPSRSPSPPIICDKERHPHTLYLVSVWKTGRFCLEYGGKILVKAKSPEECCDILEREYGGNRSEIECAVRWADTLWLANSNMSSGIWDAILH
jgi:hypothetical protein